MKEIKCILFTILVFCIILICITLRNSSFKPREFEYKGHTYIQFEHGVVHDPECPKCYYIYE